MNECMKIMFLLVLSITGLNIFSGSLHSLILISQFNPNFEVENRFQFYPKLPDGCTDPCAPNFDSNADNDDGSCEEYDTTCPANTCLIHYFWNSDNCSCLEVTITYNCNDDLECTIDYIDEITCECINEFIEECIEIGCTDPCAPNFNPWAVEEDGSCEEYKNECNDYDPCALGGYSVWYEPDCMCVVTEATVMGCTDTNNANYNPNANCMDETLCAGSDCQLEATAEGFCTSENNYQVNLVILSESLDEIFVLSNLLTDEIFDTISSNNVTIIDFEIGIMYQVKISLLSDPNCFVTLSGPSPDCIGFQVIGCTDPCAPNFNPSAEIDDGTCEIDTSCPIENCFFEYFWDSNSCLCDSISIFNSNCDDQNACTSDLVDELTCECLNIPIDACVLGCTDPCSSNYDSLATENDGSCETVCAEANCYYEYFWNEDACSCDSIYIAIVDCIDENDCTEDLLIGQDCECVHIEIEDCAFIQGCTDPCSSNFNPDAETNDGSCETVCPAANCYYEYFWNPNSCSCDSTVIEENICIDENLCTEDYINEITCECFHIQIENCAFIQGCTDHCAPNFNPEAETNDGSCEEYEQPCNLDPNNYQGIYMWDYNICNCVPDTSVIYGCPNPEDLFYNPEATSYNEDLCYHRYCEGFEVAALVECIPPNGAGYSVTIYMYGLSNEFLIEDLINGEISEPIDSNIYTFYDFPSGSGFSYKISSVCYPDCYEIVTVSLVDCWLFINGCTDPCAPNYDEYAIVSNSSCLDYNTSCPEDNCFQQFYWDTLYCNCKYDAILYDCEDGNDCTEDFVNENICECVNQPLADCQPVLACKDPCAPNYNPEATEDDGSCETYMTFCDEDPCTNGGIYSWDANTCQCVLTEPTLVACSDPCDSNYDPAANCFDDGLCGCNIQLAYHTMCVQDSLKFFVVLLFNSINPEDEFIVEDLQTGNVFDSVSENFLMLGEQYVERLEYKVSLANKPDCFGIIRLQAYNCNGFQKEGCTDPCAPNYDPLATYELDNPCEEYSTNCDPDLFPIEDLYVWDSELCYCVPDSTIVYGCLDPEDPNYNPLATFNEPFLCQDFQCSLCDTSGCELFVSTAINCVADSNFYYVKLLFMSNNPSDEFMVLDLETDEEFGPITENYFIIGTMEVGIKSYEISLMDDPTCFEILLTEPYNCYGDYLINGCTDPCAPNFDSNATLDNETCEEYDTICSSEHPLLANCVFVWDSNYCQCVPDDSLIYGCLDSGDPNYNPDATCHSEILCHSNNCSMDILVQTECGNDSDNYYDLNLFFYNNNNPNDHFMVEDLKTGFVYGPIDSNSIYFTNYAFKYGGYYGNIATGFNFKITSVCDLFCMETTSEYFIDCPGSNPGCTDPCAPNFEAWATVDDGSCEEYDNDCPPNTCWEAFYWDENSCSCQPNNIEYNCDDENACTEDYIDTINCICVNEWIVDCDSILGCTDACAPNFNPDATQNDQTCMPYDTSCFDDPCLNGGIYSWDSTACKCVISEPTVYACSDICNLNIRPNANCFDEVYCESSDCNLTVEFQIFCNPDSAEYMLVLFFYALDFNSEYLIENNLTGEFFGPTINNSLVLNGFEIGSNFRFKISIAGNENCSNYLAANTVNCIDFEIVNGCTDPCAANYNPIAQESDGSCETYDHACPDTDCFERYEWDSNTCSCILMNYYYDCDDGNPCTNDFIDENNCQCQNERIVDCEIFAGCTDPCAPNYNVNANIDDGSCGAYDISCDEEPCTNGGIFSWSEMDCDCVLVEPTIVGCTYPQDPNYDPNANCNEVYQCQNFYCDLSVFSDVICNSNSNFDLLLQIETQYSMDEIIIENLETGEIVDSIPGINFVFFDLEGPNGYNYKISISADESCYVIVSSALVDCCCGAPIEGCTDPCATNYNPSADLDDGSCLPYGEFYCQPNECWQLSTCSCINLEESACDDDDECTYDFVDPTICQCIHQYIVNCGQELGCTDPCAPNYNPNANLDDGSCEAYDAVCDDLCDLTIDSYDAINCTCVHEFGICEDGNAGTLDSLDLANCECLFIATGLDNLFAIGEIKFYPNPASNILTIEMRLVESSFLRINVYDTKGVLVRNVSEETMSTGNVKNKVSLDEFVSGLYFIEFVIEDERVVKSFAVVK